MQAHHHNFQAELQESLQPVRWNEAIEIYFCTQKHKYVHGTES